MATILTFVPRPDRPPASGRAGDGADIIIFPGVRYERLDDTPAPSGGEERGALRRKNG